MEDLREKELQKLRRRLEVLNAVIADFERLEAVRRPKAQVYKTAPRAKRYSHGPALLARPLRRMTPASRQGR
jgi:hypothetical protein